ncbi:MAG: Rpn family recombination-promoting nuclease/putative transposase [Acidobacteriota bacterium]
MSKEFPNPHDRFFKELFSETETVVDFVEHYLPQEIVAATDLATFEIVKDSFVDEELRQYFSDLLLRVKLKNGGEAFIYILLEHKSAPDEFVALQLFLYLARIWQPNLRSRTKPLPVVFPVVFYHGEEEWNVSSDFSALFDFTGLEILREYAVGLKYHLCDLSKIEITEGEPRLRAGMTTLKFIASDELPERLRGIFETIKQLPKPRVMGYIRTVLKYLSNTKHKLTQEIVRLELDAAFPDEKGDFMQTWAEEWIQEGEQRGELRGELRGEQRGKQEEAAKLTLRLLHRRFGILEAELDERIRSLSTEQLENLSEALLDFTAKSELLVWLGNATKPEDQQ